MIFDVRSHWTGQERSEHVCYEDAPNEGAAVQQAVRRGIASELGRQRGYGGLLAHAPVYYVYSNDEEVEYIGQGETFDEALGIAAGELVRHARYEYISIEIGDQDGPDARLANVMTGMAADVLLDVDAPALVPERYRLLERGIVTLVHGRNQYTVSVEPVPDYYATRWSAAVGDILGDPPGPPVEDVRTFRDQISRSPITPTEPSRTAEVMSLDEAQRRRYAGIELERSRREAPEEKDSPTSQRYGLLELNGGRRRQNPAHAGRAQAVAKYEEFHRFQPKKIGEFSTMFTIPDVLYRGGAAKWVTYRSDKTDPASGKRPRGSIDYIHEHDAGVEVFLAKGSGKKVTVPERFRTVDALCLLGTNLGYAFVDDTGDEWEAISKAPMPELYTVPDGKCLLVVQSKKTVLAMIWGGALGVFARGIDG